MIPGRLISSIRRQSNCLSQGASDPAQPRAGLGLFLRESGLKAETLDQPI